MADRPLCSPIISSMKTVPDIVIIKSESTEPGSTSDVSAETVTDDHNTVELKDATNQLNVKSNGPLKRLPSQESLAEVLSQEDLLLAATLVLDAKSGKNMLYKTQAIFVRAYILYHKWYLRWLLYLFIMLNLSLAIFEKPALSGFEAPYWGTMILEFSCLSYFTFRFIHAFYFTPPSIFRKDTKNILVAVILLLTVVDILCYCIWVNAAPDTNPVRWSRILRPMLIVNFSDGKQIRRAFRNIRRTVPEIMNVLILFLLSVLLFALLALKLFSKRNLKYQNGDAYFSNYLDSIWDLYVLVTTANDPDVMMPAYDESSWFVVFFVIYIIICLYIFMSIVLAAIYNNYKKNLKNEIKSAVYSKRKKLAQAFDIVKVERRNVFVVTHSRWSQLLQLVLPGKSQAQIDVLMRVLDADGNNRIARKEFLNLADLLQVELTEVKDRITFIEKMLPNIYNSRISGIVKNVVRHKFFRFFFDMMIFVNAWFIGFDVDESDWFFLTIFMIEIILKLYVFGPKIFFRRFWNVFDFIIIGSAVIAELVEVFEKEGHEELRTLDFILVLRVVRLIKLFGSIQRFKVIIMTIVNIGPSILTYGGIIFVFYYMYAIIGMELFHDRIKFDGYNITLPTSNTTFCGTKVLNGTAFYRNHYCNNNFNNIAKSMVVLFELTVVNQWHVITSGFVFVTNKAARIYFFIFHINCVVIVLNIFVAFILEAFILEFTLQKAGKLESAVEAKIKDLGLGIASTSPRKKSTLDQVELVSSEEPPDTREGADESEDEESDDEDNLPDLSKIKGLRFHLRKKSRKKVEVLLQQMFEGEIDPEDEGPDKLEEVIGRQGLRPRKLTLDAVT